jgi:hypothetical protein
LGANWEGWSERYIGARPITTALPSDYVAKMKQKSVSDKAPAEQVLKDIGTSRREDFWFIVAARSA